jgi:hypothetical protein
MVSRLGSALGTAALCGVAFFAAPAHAAEVDGGNSYVTYLADDGEANALTVTVRDGSVHFADSGARVDNFSGGVDCSGRDTGSVTCKLPANMRVKVKLGDRDDSAEAVAGPVKLDGGSGNDTLLGGPGADGLAGGTGDDFLQGRGGTDSYEGGDGFDRIDYFDHVAPVTANFDGVANDGAAGENENVPADAEYLVGGQGGDTLAAAPGGSYLHGSPGADSVNGGPGDDTLYGGKDGDRLYGNGGTDRFFADMGSDVVYAADGIAEQVTCGPELDYFVADPLDALFECEQAGEPDSGGGPGGGVGGGGSSGGGAGPLAPEAGRTVTVEPARGTVTIRPPGGSTVELGAGDSIPLGSVVDTTRGTVELTSATGRSGATQTAEFRGGVFQVRQTRGTKPVTELVLKGRLSCPSARERLNAAARRGASRRRLWGSGHGRFRTRGRRSSATVRGTIWMTEDRCNGTLTRVKRGVVAVRDSRTGKTTLVRAGKRHFARVKR